MQSSAKRFIGLLMLGIIAGLRADSITGKIIAGIF
tara:strand:- start:517 stop:621 length:105 start_codon:yes stop_codon:yes gene_type:complete